VKEEAAGSMALKRAPSAKRSSSAVETWNEPWTSRLALGPNITPAGLRK
jgi:hypothetical protein